jgi:hypothetical protein
MAKCISIQSFLVVAAKGIVTGIARGAKNRFDSNNAKLSYHTGVTILMNNQMQEPKLAKPGAGLPIIEWAMARYVIMPKLFKTTTREKALSLFTNESKKIVELIKELDSSKLAERRLVPRLRGLEDSSRYWSIAMAMEHLIIVSDLMREAVVQLSNGNTKLPNVGTADVKPSKDVDAAEIINRFETMSSRFIEDASKADLDAHPRATHAHPWFGPLNAHQWLVMGGVHENIHRVQIQKIIKLL